MKNKQTYKTNMRKSEKRDERTKYEKQTNIQKSEKRDERKRERDSPGHCSQG